MAAFFNIKPTRRSNPEARTTLDALHTYHVSQIKDKATHIDDMKLEISKIKLKKSECQNPIELSAIEEEENELKKNISNIESNSEMYDYFLNTGEILYNYYDIQDKIQRGIDPAPKRINVKAKPGSIMAALEEAAKTDETYVPPVHIPQEKRG